MCNYTDGAVELFITPKFFEKKKNKKHGEVDRSVNQSN